MGLGCLWPGGQEGQSHGTQATTSRAENALLYETPSVSQCHQAAPHSQPGFC